MSEAIAKIEGASVVLSKGEIVGEVRALTEKLNVREALDAYRMTINYVGDFEERKAKLLLVHVRPEEDILQVEGFRINESQQANEKYAEIEKTIPSDSSSQAVLVRVESLKALPKAYPNFFHDTKLFSDTLSEVLSW
jgi:hypothetical protein